MRWSPQKSARRDPLWLLPSAVTIVVVSYLGDRAPAGRLLLVVPAVAAFVAWSLWKRLPAELFAAVVIASVVSAVWEDGSLEGTFFLIVLMVLSVSWTIDSTARAAAIAAVGAVSAWVVNVTLSDEIGWEAWTTAALFTFAMGRLLRRQEGLISELSDARQELTQQAVVEERRRIARELHDLAGHTLAAVALHVTGARHVLRRDLDEAERALIEAEEIGRASLDQIRSAVEVLRTDERGTDAPLTDGGDVERLIDEYRRAGLDVDGQLACLPNVPAGPPALAVHRVVREALANVARHAPTNRVEVSVREIGDDIVVVVADHGTAAKPLQTTTRRFGLVGMEERARAVGGTLVAGPTPDGWRVELCVPGPVA